MFIRYMIIIGVVLFFTSSGFAQMYRYTDENGNLRFTDDLTRVPLSQQEKLERMPMIKSRPQNNISNPSATPASTSTTDALENDLRKTATDLDQTKAELDNIFNALTEKKAGLKTHAPSENASRNEMRAYRDKIIELNAEIESYQEKRGVFEEQVNAFNAVIRQ
jgi:chromosome segregation ATPase